MWKEKIAPLYHVEGQFFPFYIATYIASKCIRKLILKCHISLPLIALVSHPFETVTLGELHCKHPLLFQKPSVYPILMIRNTV